VGNPRLNLELSLEAVLWEFFRRWTAGRSYAEIATVLDCDAANVGRLLRREGRTVQSYHLDAVAKHERMSTADLAVALQKLAIELELAPDKLRQGLLQVQSKRAYGGKMHHAKKLSVPGKPAVYISKEFAGEYVEHAADVDAREPGSDGGTSLDGPVRVGPT
jgi:hypothetical protein